MEKNVLRGSPEKKSSGQSHEGDKPQMTSPEDDSGVGVSSSSETPVIFSESDVVAGPVSTHEIDVAGASPSYGFGDDREDTSEVDQRKKRVRGDVNPAGESSHGEQKAAKKKGELTDVPKGEPKCATCNKTFKSWKALFGHLRSHPERSYRGALPPPTAMELDMNQRDNDGDHYHQQQQQEAILQKHHLASTLLSAAQVVAARFSAELEIEREMRASSSSRRGLDIDLNQPFTEELGSSSNKGHGLDIDLNIVPAAETDEEDDDQT